MNFPTIPYDKALHFIYGAVICLVSFYALKVFGVSGPKHWALGVAVLAGVAKEGLDFAMNKKSVAAGQTAVHTVSMPDAVATAAGGVLVWLA